MNAGDVELDLQAMIVAAEQKILTSDKTRRLETILMTLTLSLMTTYWDTWGGADVQRRNDGSQYS